MTTTTFFLRLLLAFLLLCPVVLGQDQRRQIVQREQLRKLMSAVDIEVPETDVRTNQTQTYRELKIRWTDPTKSTGDITSEAQTQVPRASIVEDKKHSGALLRARSLELAPTLMFVAAVDATNKLRWWSIMPDPRIVRLETQTSTLELRRQDYYLADVTLVVAIPDDPEISTLRFYHPIWDGTGFDLKLLSVVSTR